MRKVLPILLALSGLGGATVLACPAIRAPRPPGAPSAASAAPPAPSAPVGPASASEALAAASGSASVEPPASASASAKVAAAPTSACNEQAPQDFLIRSNFLPLATKKDAHEKAIRYRTEHYGFVKGFGKMEWNPTTPDASATDTTFMGLKVRMNKRVVPALQCVEVEIKRACPDSPYDKAYTPMVLAGIRYTNTYKGGEITNHMYGIAIDIDPGRNSCCGCVKPWKDAPICKKKTKTIWERMEMPECWVKVFERFGFYWLGRDSLQDTMHFEFLGDPDRIPRKP